MAFGKNAELLQKIAGSMHQGLKQFGVRRPARGGRGGIRFANVYKPSEIQTDIVRLLPGDYKLQYADENGVLQQVELGFSTFIEHFFGRNKKSCICSAGPFHAYRDKRSPCTGCDIFWHEITQGKRGKNRAMSKRDMYVFNVWDYDTYYHVEQIDRDSGTIRMKEDGKTPWMEWVKKDGRNDLERAGKEKTEGHLGHWPMGSSHYQQLLDANESIGTACRSCGKKQVGKLSAIQTLAYTCSNPNCGEALIEMGDTNLNLADIKKLTSDKMVCKFCRFSGFPNEVIECLGCQNPQRATFFDVDLHVKRVKASTKEDGNQTVLQIQGWSDPYALPEQVEKAAEKLYDLPKLYGPDPIELQNKLFGDGPQAPSTRPYGDAPGGAAPPPQSRY